LLNYSLLVVTQFWRHDMSRVQAW